MVIFVPFRNRKEVRPRENLGFHLASDANPQTERDQKMLRSTGKNNRFPYPKISKIGNPLFFPVRVKENDDVKVVFGFFYISRE